MPPTFRRGFRVLAAAMLWGSAAAAPGPVCARAAALGEAQVRAFVARQERAWNQDALDAYYAGFTPDARFTDQYRTPGGQIVPYGTSTLDEARAQSRRFRQTSQSLEAGRITSITFAADGRSAQVVSQVGTRIRGPKGPRLTCAERRQTLVAAATGLRSRGQTDTFVRCR